MEEECVICFNKLEHDQPYCKIDNKRENGNYHVECLEQWLQKSNNGLYTRDKIISYSIYHNSELIESIKVRQDLYNTVYIPIDEEVNQNIQIPVHIRNRRNIDEFADPSCCILF